MRRREFITLLTGDGRSFSAAAAASASQMLATEAALFDGIAGRDWVLSAEGTSSGSPALACPTSRRGNSPPSGAASKTTERRADAVRLCMRRRGSLKDQRIKYEIGH